jgi:hypothetical protein
VIWSFENGQVDTAALLLGAGADPNAVAYEAFTPLHFATGLKGETDDEIGPTPAPMLALPDESRDRSASTSPELARCSSMRTGRVRPRR